MLDFPEDFQECGEAGGVVSNARTIELPTFPLHFARNTPREDRVHVRCERDDRSVGIGTRPLGDHVANLIGANRSEPRVR